MKLSVALIVKNEKDHIAAVLESVRGADEIIVCDTGSEDNTVELAKAYTDNVFTDFLWCDDFAAARNHALSKCTGDWVLSIDADEVLEEGGIEKIRKVIEAAGDKKTFAVIMRGGTNEHFLPRIFKNDSTVSWVGAGHEVLSPFEMNKTDVLIVYGYSTAHALDPNRMFRILEKEVDRNPNSARARYYFGREFWYKKDYHNAIKHFHQCTVLSKWIPEKSDAYLYLARCYFAISRGDIARDMCLRAIQFNPDFKEALLFMADLHYEPYKHKWLQFASLAANENVLFVRSASTVKSKIPKKLHHIWVGPKPAPTEWMQTWKDKHPDWEYALWDNEKVFGRTWRNQRHIDFYREREMWHGVADIVRYEILFEQGGFMPGADSICEHPVDELFSDGFEAYGVYENEKRRPGLISPLYACVPGNDLARLLIEGLEAKDDVGEPWISTGNTYMKEVIEKNRPPVRIFPSYVFNPVHYTGETYTGPGKIYGRQMWGTTNSLYKTS